MDGNCRKNISKLIFKARSKTLDIKTQQKWKYADKICIGCKTNEESGDEILLCEKLNYQNRVAENPINYNWFFKSTVSDIVKVGLVLENGLKEREKILEAAVTWVCCTNAGMGWQPCARQHWALVQIFVTIVFDPVRT